ncbi:MAG: hypothetical protein HC847_13450 [Hydrococcus sp. RU_2_2]|nr:hypothetical protein [Hydrococcus sp. RU_2_2]
MGGILSDSINLLDKIPSNKGTSKVVPMPLKTAEEKPRLKVSNICQGNFAAYLSSKRLGDIKEKNWEDRIYLNYGLNFWQCK